MSENGNGNGNKTVVTEVRNLEVQTDVGLIKLELRKPADRPDSKNNMIYVSVFTMTLGDEHQVANTRIVVDPIKGVQLYPESYWKEDEKKFVTVRGYPKALKSGPVRDAIEEAVAANLGMEVTFSNPMNGTPDFTEAPEEPIEDFEDDQAETEDDRELAMAEV